MKMTYVKDYVIAEANKAEVTEILNNCPLCNIDINMTSDGSRALELNAYPALTIITYDDREYEIDELERFEDLATLFGCSIAINGQTEELSFTYHFDAWTTMEFIHNEE